MNGSKIRKVIFLGELDEGKMVSYLGEKGRKQMRYVMENLVKHMTNPI